MTRGILEDCRRRKRVAPVGGRENRAGVKRFTARALPDEHPGKNLRSPDLSDDLRDQLRAELRRFQGQLTEAALAETLRLLESPNSAALTEQHARQVAEYDCIEIAGERYFERSWSAGKEAGATLGLACWLGLDSVREDLRRLRASVTGSEPGLLGCSARSTSE